MSGMSGRPNTLSCARAMVLAGIAAVLAPACCNAQGYTISTVAGGGAAGNFGDGGPATSAGLGSPQAIALDPAGNLYISDAGFGVVRKILPTGIISTVAGNPSRAGDFSGDGHLAIDAQLNQPHGIAFDAAGNLYIADQFNHRVRKVATNGTISTVAGGGTGSAGIGDHGPAINATLQYPQAVAVDAMGNLFIADTGHYLIRKVTRDGIITTIAGNGNSIVGSGQSGDGGPATSATVSPSGLAVDAAGNLYIADSTNNRVRKVSSAGIITTVAGTGAASYAGDGGPGASAKVKAPEGVAVDSSGNVFIAAKGDQRVRMLSAGGTITTIAGDGLIGSAGDGGPATSAQLDSPYGVAVDSNGLVYVSNSSADVSANLVRMLTPAGSGNGPRPSIAANGVVGASDFGRAPSIAPGSWIEIYGSNLAPDARGWGNADFHGDNAPTALDGTSVTIGGQAVFIDYISPGQVNAQVPLTVAAGAQPLIVTSNHGASAAYTVAVNANQPGLLAPARFDIGGKQYAVALFSDGVTYVLPAGAIPGVPSRSAQPGETITFYGVGFGAVAPNLPAGQIVRQSNTLVLSFQMEFGTTPAAVTFDGLAPGAVGLYQFNVVVPAVAAGNSVPLKVSLGGVSEPQTLYTAVQ
jgi:uncharacterized protein (TIGR03437 family)